MTADIIALAIIAALFAFASWLGDYLGKEETMTPHPIDTEALRRLADAAMVEPPWEDAGEWQTDGYAEYVVMSCEQDSDGEYDHVAEAANEHLGAFIAAADPNTVRALLDVHVTVRDIHCSVYESLSGQTICDECDKPWPCHTIQALGDVSWNT